MIVVVMIVTLERERRQHRRLPGAPRGASRPVSRATASIPNGATIARYSRPVRDVVVVDVPELVRDDEPQLVAREVLEQRVVEHDALRVPEAGDVGVGGRRAAARVDLVDLADVDGDMAMLAPS